MDLGPAATGRKMDLGPKMCHVFGSLLGSPILMTYSMNLHLILDAIYERVCNYNHSFGPQNNFL